MTVSTKTAEALWFEGTRLAVLRKEEVPPPGTIGGAGPGTTFAGEWQVAR